MLRDKLYVRSIGSKLYVLGVDTGYETGKLLVRVNTAIPTKPIRSPVASNGLLIVPFGDNRVFAYRP